MKPLPEIPVLDNMRAVAAWSVCLYHFICTTVGFINPENIFYKLFYFGQYGVHLFFIISGMVIPWSLYQKSYHLKNILRFMLKRLIRLEPPYLFSILLALTILYLRKYSPSYDGIDREITLRQVLLHLGYLVPFFENVTWLNNVYWTLAIEFQYYLAIGLLYFLFISPRLLVRCLGYLILTIAPRLLPHENFLPFWLPLFAIGILLFLYKSSKISLAEFLIASFVFVVHLYLFNSNVAAFIAIASILLIVFLFGYSNRFLAFLGKFSYSVYLIHPLLGATLVNVLSHYISGPFNKFLLVSGGMLVTAAGSYIMYRLIEMPSKKLSSKLGYEK
jgi:peptidoglycan/LPS O-acetylase OafA/YrhL